MYPICKEQLCLQHINNDICWFVSSKSVHVSHYYLGQQQWLWKWTWAENIRWLQLLSKFNSHSSHSINSLLITQIYETTTVSYVIWSYMHWACLLMLCVGARQKKKLFKFFEMFILCCKTLKCIRDFKRHKNQLLINSFHMPPLRDSPNIVKYIGPYIK